jgi:hypothetical protein
VQSKGDYGAGASQYQWRKIAMTKPDINIEEQSVSGDIRTKDGQIVNVKVEVPSDGSLAAEELIDAAMQMIQQSYPGAKWLT